jgi:hypothetical protein
MASFVYNESELQMDSQMILCIEENDGTSIDTRLFIGWDEIENNFFVRGRRQDTRTSSYIPYAFHCDYSRDLYDFIEFTVGKSGSKSIVLYNFNNIQSLDVSELSYEFFEENLDKNYEIAAYDDVKIKRSKIVKYLRMIRNMYNYDNTDDDTQV